MNRLIIEEPPLQVLPTLAAKIGLNEAIALQQLYYLLRDPRFGKRIAEQQWIFNTYEQWQATYFPFWSVATIKRVFTNLATAKLIECCQPEGRLSRRKYYRINRERLNELAGNPEQVNLTSSNGSNCSLPLIRSKTSKTKTRTKVRTTSLCRDDFGHDELEIIDLYHEICCSDTELGFLSITKRSPELDKALEIFQDHDSDDFREMFNEAVRYRLDGDKSRTLVRILWSNY